MFQFCLQAIDYLDTFANKAVSRMDDFVNYSLPELIIFRNFDKLYSKNLNFKQNKKKPILITVSFNNFDDRCAKVDNFPDYTLGCLILMTPFLLKFLRTMK